MLYFRLMLFTYIDADYFYAAMLFAAIFFAISRCFR